MKLKYDKEFRIIRRLYKLLDKSINEDAPITIKKKYNKERL